MGDSVQSERLGKRAEAASDRILTSATGDSIRASATDYRKRRSRGPTNKGK